MPLFAAVGHGGLNPVDPRLEGGVEMVNVFPGPVPPRSYVPRHRRPSGLIIWLRGKLPYGHAAAPLVAIEPISAPRHG